MVTCLVCKNNVKSKRLTAKFCSKKCSNFFNGKKRELENNYNHKKRKICNYCLLNLPSRNFSKVNKFDKNSELKNICKKCGHNITETNRRNKNWEIDPRQVMLNNSKQRAKHKNIEHTLVLEDIVIPKICPVLGIEIKVGSRKEKDHAPSIDRIDNSKGYTKDNIIVVSFRANVLKRDATLEELLKVASFYSRLGL